MESVGREKDKQYTWTPRWLWLAVVTRRQEVRACQKRREKRDFKEKTWGDYAKQTQNSLTECKREEACKERRTLERNPPTTSLPFGAVPPGTLNMGVPGPGIRAPPGAAGKGKKNTRASKV